MAFTKIAAAGIGSTGTVTLENVIVIGSLNTPSITGAASTENIRTNSLVVSGVTTSSGGFIGNVTGNATGLSGTPNIAVGSINASSAIISGNVSIAGTVTYEDVTNVDSVGIITARSGIHVTGGSIGIGTNNPTSKLQVIGSTDLSKLNLSGISSSISDTATDVFVYDTRKDSDGGAWRKRTQHTSWYNETLNTATRGSRRDFPAVAVIVATSSSVTIYDGDDPDMPMWMVIPSNTVDWASNPGDATSLFCLNGILSIGTIGAGTVIFEFISDRRMIAYATPGYQFLDKSISARGIGSYTSAGGYIIVSSSCNDVAMTVLPNAPIDPSTGLPVPTIAVATAGGVSVIKDDGNVVDITGQTEPPYRITFNRSNPNEIITSGYWTRVMKIYNIPSSDVGEGTELRYYVDSQTPKLPFGGGSMNFESSQTQELFVSVSGGTPSNGFYKIAENLQSKLNGMTAYIRTDCNTGWMHGDIKGAWLSDTSTASVTGTELITNGTFATNTTGWSNHPDYPSAVLSIDTNRLKILGGGAQQSFSTVIGKTYVVVYTLTAFNPGGIYLGTAATGNTSYSYFSTGSQATGTYIYYFTATNTTAYITLFAWNAGTQYAFYDDVSVRLTELDRSVNNKGLAVYGTITKTAVATGSNLVAYSGFSDGDYLKQPHNSSLEFGTGSFSCTVWFKSSTADVSNYKGLVYLNRNGSVGEGFQILLSPSNDIYFYVYGPTNDFSGTSYTGYNDGNWHQISVSSTGTHQRVYLDGVLKETGNITTGSITDTSSELFIGKWYGAGDPFYWRGSIALCRISASIPSPEQILKIYNDEKALFQPNSQCTLYGSSDAVTALAYDETTRLLSVGTSSGRSDFQGLERINNTTTAVTTAISASNGLIAEQ